MAKAEMKKTRKKLWKIELSYAQGTYYFYRWTKERDFALTLGILALAKKLNLSWRSVDYHIKDGFDRYLVTEVKRT